ncbi:asparagine synthase-domain-containing protein [Syncephalis fuscata]|nr:asparagine synthase-domain-containing protein [Syncephalis fuscata]
MCGIVFTLQVGTVAAVDSDQSSETAKEWQQLAEDNRRRGPDAIGEHTCRIENEVAALDTASSIKLHFMGATLHLRGPETTQQPIVDEQGNVLCWNGEVFGGLEIGNRNDGVCLLKALAASQCPLSVMHTIRGPYGFVYYQAKEQRLWFGRDCLGRRSLLWRYREEKDVAHLTLASVGLGPVNTDADALNEVEDDTNGKIQPNEYATEVPASGIFSIHLPLLFEPSMTICQAMRLTQWISPDLIQPDSVNYLPLPFYRLNKVLPTDGDLSLVSEEVLPWDSPECMDILEPIQLNLAQLLSEAVSCRVIGIPPHVQDGARLGILFSGGIDCMCLAMLADRHVPAGEPIDLINVAFENPRTLNKNHTAAAYDVPDRKTGRCGLAELRQLRPDRCWQFVEVNVPYADACAAKPHIARLMSPASTLMDMSIAMALWFAAGGNGSIAGSVCVDDKEDTVRVSYNSPCPVLLSGLGADELFAGYTRHREAWRRNGWNSLIEEVQLDLDRISSRNLGRDDRVISDRAREVRFPFLDESVISYACSLPIHLKINPHLPRGVGEKLLLRTMAACELGLKETSTRWKRAIQFGARTAKMESGKERGTHRAV